MYKYLLPFILLLFVGCEDRSVEGLVSKFEMTTDNQHCIVSFKDGRRLQFRGIPTKPIETRRYYRIYYYVNNNDIGSVQELPDKSEVVEKE